MKRRRKKSAGKETENIGGRRERERERERQKERERERSRKTIGA